MTDAVSLWRNADAERTRINNFRFADGVDTPDIVRVPRKTWLDRDLPDNVQGWPIVVTHGGEHIHGEIIVHDQSPADHRLRITRQQPSTVSPLP